MIANERIGRLQSLLERVQSRAAVPRAGGNGAAKRADLAPVAYATPIAEPAAVELAAFEPAAFEDEQAAMSAAPDTLSHAHGEVNPAVFPSAPAADESDDVEVSSELVEVDIDEAEVEMAEAELLESGAQLVAQPSPAPDELEEVVDEEPLEAAAAPTETASDDDVDQTAAAPANEIEEPAPSSSRRPIAGEEPVAAAAESAPRHTPPPESGKQVAGASVPPPSVDSPTLIGGWREPGLVVPPQLTAPALHAGVGVPLPGRAAEPPPVVHAQASGTRLTADVTEPKLTDGANVATFQGEPAVAKPNTLGELLDLTLSL